jgi:hypothetical protein
MTVTTRDTGEIRIRDNSAGIPEYIRDRPFQALVTGPEAETTPVFANGISSGCMQVLAPVPGAIAWALPI